MEELLKTYNDKLELKKRRIKEYIEEKDSLDGFKSSKREKEHAVLKVEIELLTRFINDLKNIR